MHFERLTRGIALALVAACALPTSLPGQDGPGAPATPAVTRDTARATLRAVRREGQVSLDGRLDEPAWAAAPEARAFTQSYPQPGQPPTDPTSVRVLYDDEALWVGVRMYDANPDSIAAQLARRDASGIYSDWVHVIIDSYRDRRTSFRFTVNPRGVQKDVYTSNDGNEDVNWDAVWEVATRVDDEGWVAEYRIPLSQLRYGPAPEGAERVWGFQVMRDVARRNERASFSPWTPQSPGFVSSFGDLTGLVGVGEPRRLEVLPYVSTKAVRAPGSALDPFYSSTDLTPAVGGDVRMGLPGGFTLTGTVNPDFGQVEVDPAVVNLTAFETFFPEKRPFFLEGSDVFSFGNVRSNNSFNTTTFLYSRRIGRNPSRAGALGADPGVAYFDAPEQTRILGAAKVTGRQGPWTIGVLDAVTAREEARVVSPDGVRGEAPIEPLTNYFAGRVRRDLRDGQTVVGAMLTNTTRDMGDDVFAPILGRRATFAGLDFEHAWKDRTWFLSGYGGYSRVEGTPEMITALQRSSIHQYQRPDAGHVDVDPARTSLPGYTYEVALQKTGAWFGSVSFKDVSPGFDVNDLGFHGRVDLSALSTLVGYSSSRAGEWIRQRSYYAYHNSAWNHDGQSLRHSANASASLTFNSFWSAGANVGVFANAYSDRLTRGGPLAGDPRGWSASVDVGSDSRRPIVASADLSHTADVSGARSSSLGLSLSARPSSNLSVRIGPSLGVDESTSQYVRAQPDALATDTYGTRYVFADLRQTTLSLDTRVEWTLTPTLSFQTYIQPFVAVGRFEHFKEFTTPGSFDFAVYGTDRGTIAHDAEARTWTVDPDGEGAAPQFVVRDPTFNTRSLRGNAVVRWEYRPGSALYL
ncbi:MAG TPA: DUF5916 domain-containing protein, partial [Gemmatimonadaceae bacterium]|nr:DUF5916 domain-containing protein [Gemmatimonadaceae bacterium]